MTSLALLIAPLLALQGVGQTAVAIKNDTPETWTLEYPRIIQPFVEDYRRCLRTQNRLVTGRPDFEEQHRADLPRCVETLEEAQAEATRITSGRTGYEAFTSDNVRQIFETIGRIHIARGADLDAQFTQNLAAAQAARDTYQEDRPRGLVLELRDASVVKARTDATAPAAETALREREVTTVPEEANAENQ